MEADGVLIGFLLLLGSLWLGLLFRRRDGSTAGRRLGML